MKVGSTACFCVSEADACLSTASLTAARSPRSTSDIASLLSNSSALLFNSSSDI